MNRSAAEDRKSKDARPKRLASWEIVSGIDNQFTVQTARGVAQFKSAEYKPLEVNKWSFPPAEKP